jgi:hypothetical protein
MLLVDGFRQAAIALRIPCGRTVTQNTDRNQYPNRNPLTSIVCAIR